MENLFSEQNILKEVKTKKFQNNNINNINYTISEEFKNNNLNSNAEINDNKDNSYFVNSNSHSFSGYKTNFKNNFILDKVFILENFEVF